MRFKIVFQVIAVTVSIAIGELPYSLPTEGNVETIGTNTPMDLVSVFPAATAYYMPGAVMGSFGSGAFIRDYSPHGAYVMAGLGGHAAPLQITGAVLFDFEDATWKGFENTNGVPSYMGQNYGVEQSNGNPWVEWNGTEVPIPPHPYLAPVELPASLGGGPKGSLVYLGRGAVQSDGSGARGPHAFNLDTKRWSRLTSVDHPRVVGIYTAVVLDEVTGRYYPVGNIQNAKQLCYYDAANWDTLMYTEPLYLWPSVGGGSRAFLDSVRRLIIDFSDQGQLNAFQLDNPSAGWTTLAVSGALPPITTPEPCRWAFYPPDGNFYYRPSGAYNGPKLYRLIPPASNPVTTAWIADSVDLNQSLPPCEAPDNAWYNFLFYVPSIQCLAWIAGADKQVYVFKPPAGTKVEMGRAVSAPATVTVQPNPFKSSVTLTLPGAFSSGATVKIFDLSGRLMADLSGRISHGRAVWNAPGLTSGVYAAVAQKGALKLTKKMMYTR